MNKRERILGACVAVLVLAIGGNSLVGRYQSARSDRQVKLQEAQQKLFDAKLALAKGRTAADKMKVWEERSLPASREKASSLYKAWLLEKAKSAGLTVTDIKLAPRMSASKAYDAIGYQITASGSLSSVTAMLYEFYRSPQLHQITKLNLSRPPGTPQMAVALDVEAIILPGAVATEKLPEGDSKRLKLASAAEYQKSLSERDLATVYAAPKPPAPPTERRDPPAPPKFDDAEQAFFSGLVGSGNGLQAWIYVRTTGETLHLAAGDPVKVGSLEGQIESIDKRSLVFKMGDKKYRVALGESLRKGKELDANGEIKAPSEAEQPKS
jgi:hypothetical protein